MFKSFKRTALLLVATSTMAATLYAAGPETAKFGGKWGTTNEEALAAMHLKGDLARGEELYDDVCVNCHQAGGNGDPSGAFPQLAGQHSSVIIKQLADIRQGNRDNPTMFPFAGPDALTDDPAQGPQALADVAVYIQTLKMLDDNVQGPGGTLYVFRNNFEVAPEQTFDMLQKKLPRPVYDKLMPLKNKEYTSKKDFEAALDAAIGVEDRKKHEPILLEVADWSSDLKLGAKLYKENCVKCHGDHGQGDVTYYYPVIAGQNYFYLMRQFSWIKRGKRRNANPDMVKQIHGFSPLDLRSVLDTTSRFKMKPGDWAPHTK